MSKEKILIIDDERNTREGLAAALQERYCIYLAESAQAGMQILKQENISIVLTDLRMPGMDGMEFTRQVSSWENAPLIIMLTAYGSVQTAIEAMKQGAYDYLSKPINLDDLEMMIERGLETLHMRLENKNLRQELAQRQGGAENIIGNSALMLQLLSEAKQVAQARTTVLITGESGTGKELFANAIHQISPRREQPFVVVHCAALNENLLESELFGHEKGAFTGATERQIGRFERADRGSLFLDEIGEISPATQVKLLRVLENRQLERVGGSKPIDIDVRLLAATNRDLKKMVAEGSFREDLYYRLNVVNLHLPPLRAHPEDIEPLLNHYLRLAAEDNAKKINAFSSEAIKVLVSYDWPGNVRELRNAVERMVVFARGSSLTLNDVPVEIRQALGEQLLKPKTKDSAETATASLDIKANEKNVILQALEQCEGNRSKAAELLGISRRTLQRKLKEYQL
ncbi:MAG: sigma-54 dependent transcriptional regulator [Lentisphaeria bacterium]|nr:sigma-54 dependent transcriptional regulator [Lentisphaeria bacterium]MDY0176075.1 sigma-54 dependent transcriptional regulator [Lentisphaeria bacterium]NLZ60782.1 sigma-54-dependent Fis family transcriptional regulator [Lentisphaerota bacterium]